MQFKSEKDVMDFVMQTASVYWARALNKHSMAKIGRMPEIRLNKRLTATGGRACILTARNKKDFPDLVEFIDYAYKLIIMPENMREYRDSIIPHELAHFVALRAYGEENHGPMFYLAGGDMGVVLTRCHTLKYIRRG